MEPVILVADEEALIVSRLAELLEREGFSVLRAYTSEQALTKLAVNKVDLILASFSLREMNGVELLQKVKLLYPEIKRGLLVSGVSSPSIRRALRNGTVQLEIEKPWERKELIEKIYHLLALKDKA